VNLLIFDECHHAKKNHPFNVIMAEFYRPLTDDKPKIFGMTASPATGTQDVSESIQ
jgi:endoribonuclease Dicer